MPLPSLIEIVPLTPPVRAAITVPGSKSITNRALILAALAEGIVTLKGALWSEDTQIMVACLQQLGFKVTVEADPAEACNRTITVVGEGGRVPPGGSEEKPFELFVGNAGTAARFLAPFLCLGSGVYRLHGVPRMHERPQAALFQALRELRYKVESENGNDKLPARIFGDGEASADFSSQRNYELPTAQIISNVINLGNDRTTQDPPHAERWCKVSIEASSQFASALLLSAKIGRWDVEISGENAEESPYVAMTSKMMEAFPNKGGKFQIEGDASSGSYFLAATIAEAPEVMEFSEQFGIEVPTRYNNSVRVINWPVTDWQIDARFSHFKNLGGKLHAFVQKSKAGKTFDDKTINEIVSSNNREISRIDDLGDSIMTAIVMTSISHRTLKFTDLGRLRLQECERVFAMRTELTKCGAKVIEEGDTLTVYPSQLHGAEIETYHDHRMAMCFAILGLKVPGIKIKDPACVKKTFPNFFQKLAAAPPHGLGVTILDEHGRRLALEELFAE